jgi:hypothetical protein
MSSATPAIIQLAYNPVLGGVLSSACFAILSSIYLLCLRRMRNVSLRSLIPSSDSNVAVVCPASSKNGGPSKEACMTAEEAMALAEVLQCVGTLNKRPGVYSCTETMRQSGVVSLGGLQKNAFTKTLLSEFCPGLGIDVSSSHGDEDDEVCIRYGSKSTTPTPERSIAFIIYLSGSITGCENSALLIFGQYGIDTVAAARYVRTRARQLYCDFRGRDFAVLLETHPSLGYQGFPKRHQNISAAVFASQVSQPRRRQLTARRRNVTKGLQHAG